MKQIILTQLLFIILLKGYSQNDTTSFKVLSTSVSTSFCGGIVYPGIQVSLDFPMYQKKVHKNRKRKLPKTNLKTLFLSPSIGWYHHKGFHDNLYLSLGYTYRNQNIKGFFTSHSLSIGYARTFLNGKTFKVIGENTLKEKKLSGYNYALVSLEGALGYQFTKKLKKPISIYSGLNIMLMFPYNNTLYLRPNIMIGLNFSPSGFINRKVKSQTKHK